MTIGVWAIDLKLPFQLSPFQLQGRHSINWESWL